MSVPQNIQELANKVRNEIYGRDVRESIAKSMEATGEVAEWSRQVAQDIVDGKFDEGELATEIERKLNELEVEYTPRLNSLETDLAQTEQDLDSRGLSVRHFGVKYDGTDETIELQNAINYCQTNKRPLFSESKTIVTTGVDITSELTIRGELNLEPLNDNQPYVLFLGSSLINFEANIVIDGKEKAINGIVGNGFARTRFSNVEARFCKGWGFTFIADGNNNFVTFNRERYLQNGARVETQFTQISSTNIGGAGGYSVIDLATPLEDYMTEPYMTYFLIHEGNAYRISKISSNTRIEVNHINIGNGNTSSATVIVGGGLNIPKHGDSGVGYHGSIDVYANRGIGVHQSSLYGHQYDNYIGQGNGIGFACQDLSFSTQFNKPYFEVNLVDFVVFNYLEGTMFSPLIDVSGMQFLISRHLNGISIIPDRFKVIKQNEGNYTSNLPSERNPGTRTLNPGFAYSFSKSSGGLSFTINNDPFYTQTRSNYIELNLTHETKGSVTITLSDTTNETIMGSDSYTFSIRKNTLVKMYKVGLDWFVTILRDDVMESISVVPASIGQLASVNGVGYMATGTNSTSDWKQITNT